MVDFDRSALGVESAPVSYDVEKGAIRKFAEAIGDDDPIYADERAAQAAGFKTIVAPPTTQYFAYLPLVIRNAP